MFRVKHKTLGTEYTTVEVNPEYESVLAKPAVDSYGWPLPPKHRTAPTVGAPDSPSTKAAGTATTKPEEAK